MTDVATDAAKTPDDEGPDPVEVPKQRRPRTPPAADAKKAAAKKAAAPAAAKKTAAKTTAAKTTAAKTTAAKTTAAKTTAAKTTAAKTTAAKTTAAKTTAAKTTAAKTTAAKTTAAKTTAAKKTATPAVAKKTAAPAAAKTTAAPVPAKKTAAVVTPEPVSSGADELTDLLPMLEVATPKPEPPEADDAAEPKVRRGRVARVAWYSTVALLAAFLLVCAVWTITGGRTYVVTTPSMSPTVPVGSLVLTRPVPRRRPKGRPDHRLPPAH